MSDGVSDGVDELVIAVRADTRAFARDVAVLRAEMMGPLADGAARAGSAIEAALSRAVVTGKLGFEDLKRVALSVMAEIARSAISNVFSGAGGGQQGGGGLLGLATSLTAALLGAPGRATGGPVSAGRAYKVGERGPELFVPTAAGRIEASGAGVGQTVNITVNLRSEGGGGDAQRMQASGRQVARAVRRAMEGAGA